MKKQEGWSVFSSAEVYDLYSAWEDGNDEVWHKEFRVHGIDPEDYDDANLVEDPDAEGVYQYVSFRNSVGDEVIIENAFVEDELRDYADAEVWVRDAEGAWRE